MPFIPLTEVEPSLARQAELSLCAVFDVPSLHGFQIQAGHNILKGRNTILDVPTGGGKTLAFYYPLFYYWTPGNSNLQSKKTILVISPLVGLMESQAVLLNEKGIPAISLSSSPNLDTALTDFGSNMYRVGFIGPEMARSTLFHKRVVESSTFQTSLIAVNIDEAHCISEWGTDDFCSDYARLSELLAKLPSEVPVLTASATLAPEVIQDIETKLGLGRKCERISVSNEKHNVGLSIHPAPMTSTKLLYMSTLARKRNKYRISYEDIHQSLFLKSPLNSSIDSLMILTKQGYTREFQVALYVQSLQPMRLEWVLISKIGRCVRIFSDLDPSAPEWEAVGSLEDDDDDKDMEDEEDGGEELVERRPKILDDQHENDDASDNPRQMIRRVKRKKFKTYIEARDRWFLAWFVVTEQCRRVPWNKFYGNDSKVKLPLAITPAHARCCDNCEPAKFPIETVRLTDTANEV
ncbi:P-loop containing nucleoside triphosphate hydrolase protein [Lentinula raphanica]|uniref:DNA 3'-5' helicase n=1 Tax=Lentinula raphanica TaxID=153919 RepID=A0AA38NWQ0_9AGAR|nr:P-loop containing nucleoside triphosphate hydrolase protein [Lentinula raphanica]